MKKKLQLNKETMAVLNMSEMSKVVGQAAGECPPENEEYVVFLPHEEDCGMFYKCDWGTPVLHQCPDGLYFNAGLGVCDFPEKAGCEFAKSRILCFTIEDKEWDCGGSKTCEAAICYPPYVKVTIYG